MASVHKAFKVVSISFSLVGGGCRALVPVPEISINLSRTR